MPDPDVTPTQQWQAMVPALTRLDGAGDTAERLLLLLHYSIDWNSSWVSGHLKTYWDDQLPGRVRRAAYRADTLDRWWTEAASRLGATAPRQADRRNELALLLREPPLEVLSLLQTSLLALVLRVRIIAEAVKDDRKEKQQ
ncbi:Uncharacterised protein [Mycobacteroides abscessus subsp. bolletii]|uniref:hypothetical protein n=1 Tax=Mycobacteroides abscessus TaxID=36809 RepID=UPI0009A5BD8E|nr:hypothetical protein [Mycobacteroides abscessus]SKY97560.1 Uncharacterised protein [Mycobacteroides abscessus subsp. bolletii]